MSSKLLVTRTGIKARSSSILGLIRPLILELLGSFNPILFILAGNEDMHKISDEFEFRPDRTSDYGVSCLLASKEFPIDL